MTTEVLKYGGSSLAGEGRFEAVTRLGSLICRECMEMAAAGARVLHARRVEMAWRYRVPL